MIVYQYRDTLHLYPKCRGVRGERVELDDTLGEEYSEADQAFGTFKVCSVCKRRQKKEFRAGKMKELNDSGLSLAEIGRRYHMSRQAVFQLVKSVEVESD